VSGDQLPLPVADSPPDATTTATARRLPPRIVPMLAEPGPAPFDDPDYLFEPWWPGIRLHVFIEAAALRFQGDQMADPAAAFPELHALVERVAVDGVVLDGTLLVLDDDAHPDPGLLRRRLADPSERGGHPAFVASDLLYEDGRSLLNRPFAERRERLLICLRDSDEVVVARGFREEGRVVARALSAMGIEALSARRLSARHRGGAAGEAWLRLPVEPAPAPRQRPSLTLIQRLPL
jgi:bifunctional non-homologous end joining protein LigD